MRFTSTRNNETDVGFEQAIRFCMPDDGGLYIPSGSADLRKWILYSNEQTSYASVAGAMTLAYINEEFSPVICETIATHAFPYEPVLRKLDDSFYMLELFHGPTGWQRDFGTHYLAESLETILRLKDSTAIFLDATHTAFGAVLAHALKGKKRIKSVILFPKGQVRGLTEQDYIWNGGNVYPIEVDGDESACRSIIRQIFADRSFASALNLTVANTANIGRLLPQTFFYPFAFSRLKNMVHGSIYYALAPESFGSVVAGLYSWRLAMPVSGFIVPATDSLGSDALGNCTMLDAVVPLEQREPADPSAPSNLERLEEVFRVSPAMLRNLVFPVQVDDAEVEQAVKELYMNYHVYAGRNTAMAYAAAKKGGRQNVQPGDAVVVLAKNHPSLDAEYIRHCLGEAPAMPDTVAAAVAPVQLRRPRLSSVEDVKCVLSSLQF